MSEIIYHVEGELKIYTPGVANFQEIRKEILLQSPERTVTKSTYPNGFVIQIDQDAHSFLITCNHPLIDNGDGSFTAPTDK